jgi:hypothetical protein
MGTPGFIAQSSLNQGKYFGNYQTEHEYLAPRRENSIIPFQDTVIIYGDRMPKLISLGWADWAFGWFGPPAPEGGGGGGASGGGREGGETSPKERQREECVNRYVNGCDSARCGEARAAEEGWDRACLMAAARNIERYGWRATQRQNAKCRSYNPHRRTHASCVQGCNIDALLACP